MHLHPCALDVCHFQVPVGSKKQQCRRLLSSFPPPQDGKPTGGLRGMLSNARASLLARFAPRLEEPLPSSSSSSNGAGPLPPPISVRSALPWLAGATAVASLALYAASVARSMGWQPWQPQPPEPLPPAMAEAAAAIGLPEYAVRPHYSAELDAQLSQRRARQPAAVATAVEQQQQPAAAISRQAATRLVQQWLVSGAAELCSLLCCCRPCLRARCAAMSAPCICFWDAHHVSVRGDGP